MDVNINNDDFRINRLTLQFFQKQIEEVFFQNYVEKTQSLGFYILIAAIIPYELGGILEYLSVHHNYFYVFLIRFAFSLPLFLITLALVKIYKKYFHIFVWMVIANAGFSAIAMASVSQFTSPEIYYPGIYIICLVTIFLFPLKYLFTTFLSFCILTTYNICSVLFSDMPTYLLINNIAFSYFINMVIAIAGYSLEYSIRRDYTHEQLLQREKEHSEELLLKAQAANKAKTEFLAVMSHELRTPLNAIIGFSEIIKNQLLGPMTAEKPAAKYKEYAEDIYGSGRHLLSLIQDILDLSRAETGRLTLKEDRFDMAMLIDRCGRMVREKAAEGGLKLEVNLPHPSPQVWADERLIAQVIINLLGNAIKFTPQGGSITLSTEIDECGIGIKVSDTGIGIAPENIPRVVQPFVQVESAWRREHTGAGVGLGLVSKIIELHGGTLNIQSELGKGTQVTAWLPKRRIKSL